MAVSAGRAPRGERDLARAREQERGRPLGHVEPVRRELLERRPPRHANRART